MAEEPQVYFCDITNESVPERDLELGRAVRIQGRVIGADAVDQIRAAGARAPAASEGRLLPVALILLAAVAAATIFLDHRVTEEASVAKTDVQGLATAMGDQDARMATLERALEGAPQSMHLEALGGRIDGVQTGVSEAEARLVTQLDRQQQVMTEMQRVLFALRDGQPDYMPTFDRIQSQIQQLALDVADLKAMPRGEPRDAMLDDPPPQGGAGAAAAAEGLPPELVHQVARLADPDPGARFEAVDELLRSKNAAVREHLLPMAKDPDTFVRRLTVEGLRDFHHASCVDALLVALADPEEIVRDTAWRSLVELTGQKHPFEATAPKDARARMQQRWRDWWQRNKDGFAP